MKKSVLKLAIAAAAFASVGAMAATLDGVLSPSTTGSQGTVDIRLQKGDAVQISNLNDLFFGPLAATLAAPGTTTIQDDVCIFSTLGNFRVQASGLNDTATSLRMASGISRLPYTLELTNAVELAPVSLFGPSALLAGGETTNLDCGGPGFNAVLKVVVDNALYNGTPAGVYTDTVTLLVTAP